MKIQKECVPCQLRNAVNQVQLATDDEELRFEALRSYLQFFASNLYRDKLSAYFGPEKDRIIRDITSEADPYSELKSKSNDLAFMLEDIGEDYVEDGHSSKERIGRALKVSAAANSMEFDVSGHDFVSEKFESEFRDLLNVDLGFDDTVKVSSEILSSDEVFFIADNAGEIVLDRLLLKEIQKQGIDLRIGVKTKPIQEDVTLKMAKELNLDEFGELVPTGRTIGLLLERVPGRVKELLENSEFIIGKGMGNYETMSEFEEKLQGRLSYVLRAKCNPVARALGIDRGDLVVKFVE